MQPDILMQLAEQLYGLRDTRRIIPFARVAIGDGSAPDDWTPTPKFCHANVETWVMRSPDYAIVRGWVVFDQSVLLRRFQFAAHSVIGTPDGRLLDITPSYASQPYPFIHHPGTTEEFDQLRHQYQIMFIDHYLDT